MFAPCVLFYVQDNACSTVHGRRVSSRLQEKQGCGKLQFYCDYLLCCKDIKSLLLYVIRWLGLLPFFARMFFCINYSLQSSDFYSRSLMFKLTLMEGDYDFIDVCSFIIYLPFIV